MQNPVHLDFVAATVRGSNWKNLEPPHVVSRHYVVTLRRQPPPRHVELFTMADNPAILPEWQGQKLSKPMTKDDEQSRTK
jgi:hypothetical protein